MLTQTYSVKNLEKSEVKASHDETTNTDGITKNKVLYSLPTDRACAEVRLWDASGVVDSTLFNGLMDMEEVEIM